MRGEDADVSRRNERAHDHTAHKLAKRKIRDGQLAARIANNEQRADSTDDERNRASRPQHADDSADKRDCHVRKAEHEHGTRVGVVVDEYGIGGIVGVLDRVRAGAIVGPIVQGVDRGLREDGDRKQQAPDERRKVITAGNGIDAAEDRREHRRSRPCMRRSKAHGHERRERLVTRRLHRGCHRLRHLPSI